MVSRHLGELSRTNCVEKISIEAFKYRNIRNLLRFFQK